MDEAKKTDQQYAGFWIRVAAAISDGIIGAIILIVFGFLQGDAMRYFNDSTVTMSGFDYLAIIILFAYSIGSLTLWGATPGKMLCGIRVVKEDGSKVGLGRVLLREIIGKFISQIVIFLGYIWVAFDAKKQGWHDKIAGTVVIKK